MSNRRIVARLTLIALFAALWAFAAGGCAGAETETFGNDDDGSTSSQGGAVGQGGTTASTGGMGGNPGPCGTDCSLINTPDCQVAQCNATTGQCEVVNDEDGVACDDGLFCTISDSCLAGTCTGGPPNDCGMAPPQCTEVTCDETSQTCSTAPAMNGSMCQDPNNLCMKGATCSNGLCIGGTPDDCFFFPVPSDCHVATCNPSNGMCEAQIGNEGGACNDPMDLCTVQKTCNMGMCEGGTPKNCSQLTQGCVVGVCDVNNGQCVAQAVGQGQPCDDLNFCTTGEICNNGVCGGGAPVTQCTNGDGCCPMNCNENNDIECAIPSGVAYLTNGNTINVQYHECGTNGQPGQCTAANAQQACQNVGMKVVSHASNGTSTVATLGATTSCNWSISYYTVGTQMAQGECLVGVSNLMWSSCCNTSSWHGNTIPFGAPNTIFGYVYTTNSGYNANFNNVTGDTWGCNGLTTAAQDAGCTKNFVACTP